MGINQDNQFDTILNKEKHITVDYIHEFDGGNLKIYIPKINICIFKYSILETIFLNVTFCYTFICSSDCAIYLCVPMFHTLNH